jgi:hypothetical protein
MRSRTEDTEVTEGFWGLESGLLPALTPKGLGR